MRYAIVAAAAALSFASPAAATIGLLCKPLGGGLPHVGIVFGAGASGGIASVHLKEGGVWRTSFHKEDGLVLTRSSVRQPWVQADFVDNKGPQRRGKLRVRISGYTASGSFSLNGRTWKVRCVQD
ncbi:MAG TPA: hypothetical protein VGB59_00135 [Allosphingosinicella sp.]|jgi:hypothetical protein